MQQPTLRLSQASHASHVFLLAALCACDAPIEHAGMRDVGASGDVGAQADVGGDDNEPPGECQPMCDSASCGSDGCGGTCGSCEVDEVCAAGECTALSGEGCPAPGPYGAEPGDTVSNVTLYDCDGNPVELHSLCARRASLVYSFAEWCPGCRDVVRERLVQGHSALAERGDLSTWVVLTATDNGSPVDTDSCRRVRDEFDVVAPGLTMLHDPTQQLNAVLGMRLNESALILKRRSEVVHNRPSFWSTMERAIEQAFDETSP